MSNEYEDETFDPPRDYSHCFAQQYYLLVRTRRALR